MNINILLIISVSSKDTWIFKSMCKNRHAKKVY